MISGLEIKDLRPAVDFVNSYRKIYMKHVHEDGVSLATINKDKPVYNLEESENEEIEVMGNRDEASRIPESVQNVKNVPSKVSTAKVLFPASKLIPKDKPSREIVKTSVITDEVSESMEETSKKQGPSNVSPEFIRKSTIFISDSEVSLLEINVNSPSFQDISMEANIPKQQRLRILSPGSRNERGIRHSIEAILSKKKYTSSAMVTDISSHPPPQVQIIKNNFSNEMCIIPT